MDVAIRELQSMNCSTQTKVWRGVENTTPTLSSSWSCCSLSAQLILALLLLKSAGVWVLFLLFFFFFLGKFWVTDGPVLLGATKSQGLHKQQHMAKVWLGQMSAAPECSAGDFSQVPAMFQGLGVATQVIGCRESQNYLGWEGTQSSFGLRESQNYLGWEGTQSPSSATPCHGRATFPHPGLSH